MWDIEDFPIDVKCSDAVFAPVNVSALAVIKNQVDRVLVLRLRSMNAERFFNKVCVYEVKRAVVEELRP